MATVWLFTFTVCLIQTYAVIRNGYENEFEQQLMHEFYYDGYEYGDSYYDYLVALTNYYYNRLLQQYYDEYDIESSFSSDESSEDDVELEWGWPVIYTNYKDESSSTKQKLQEEIRKSIKKWAIQAQQQSARKTNPIHMDCADIAIRAMAIGAKTAKIPLRFRSLGGYLCYKKYKDTKKKDKDGKEIVVKALWHFIDDARDKLYSISLIDRDRNTLSVEKWEDIQIGDMFIFDLRWEKEKAKKENKEEEVVWSGHVMIVINVKIKGKSFEVIEGHTRGKTVERHTYDKDTLIKKWPDEEKEPSLWKGKARQWNWNALLHDC